MTASLESLRPFASKDRKIQELKDERSILYRTLDKRDERIAELEERLKDIYLWLKDQESGKPTARLTSSAIAHWFNEDQSEVEE